MQLTQTQLTEMNHRDPSIVDGVIIHHSVFDKMADITQIAAMEKAAQNFITVGYHCYLKCVEASADLWIAQMGRPLDCVPAAALGYNLRSYDICLGGNYEPNAAPFLDTVSENALKIIADQIIAVKTKCPNLKYLDGHRDVARWTSILAAEGKTSADVATACPGDLLYARLHDLRVMTGLQARPAP